MNANLENQLWELCAAKGYDRAKDIFECRYWVNEVLGFDVSVGQYHSCPSYYYIAKMAWRKGSAVNGIPVSSFDESNKFETFKEALIAGLIKMVQYEAP